MEEDSSHAKMLARNSSLECWEDLPLGEVYVRPPEVPPGEKQLRSQSAIAAASEGPWKEELMLRTLTKASTTTLKSSPPCCFFPTRRVVGILQEPILTVRRRSIWIKTGRNQAAVRFIRLVPGIESIPVVSASRPSPLLTKRSEDTRPATTRTRPVLLLLPISGNWRTERQAQSPVATSAT